MKFLVEDDVRQLFARLCTGLAAALLAAECASWALCPALCLPLLGLFVLLAAGVLGSALLILPDGRNGWRKRLRRCVPCWTGTPLPGWTAAVKGSCTGCSMK